MTTTAYQFADTLPKDTGGDKFISWVNENGGSDLHFVLPMGIGKHTTGSKIFGHLGVGTHTATSKLETSAVGVAIGGVQLTTQTASPLNNGQFGLAQISKYGEILTNSVAKSPVFFTSTSTLTGSSYLYGVVISGSNINSGDNLTFRNGSVMKFVHFIRPDTFTEYVTLPQGGMFFGASSGIVVEFNITGTAASVTAIVDR